MFDSLDEQIRRDDSVGTTRSERIFKWLVGVALAVAVFGGLYLVIQQMEY